MQLASSLRGLARLSWLMGLLGLPPLALAQGPADVLPATTVAAFSLSPTSGGAVFEEVLASLDLEGARATLARFAAFVGDDEVAAAFGNGVADDLAASCPAAADRLGAEGLAALHGPAVLAVSVSPFNPLPALLAVARPDDADAAAALQDTLIDCFGSDLFLSEGDVRLHVLGDGGDFPLVVARSSGLFVAGSEPEVVRAALRIAAGSSEPRFVDTPLGRAAAPLMGDGMAMAVDTAALATVLEAFVGLVPAQEAEPAIDRLLATLRTAGGFAARMTLDADGIRFDSVTTPDASGGDATLLRLLACEVCRPAAPQLVPTGVVSLQGHVLSLTDLVAFLDGFLADLGASGAERRDVRSTFRELAGVDLDAALLDWIGTSWHVAQLAPFDTDLRSWIMGPATLTVVPVLSEEAARAGIALWRDALERLPSGALVLADAFVPAADDGEGVDGFLSVRSLSFRGIDYERWRIGPSVDVAVAVVGGHLVIASPAVAMRAAIDVAHGAPDVAADPLLGPALRALPANATGYTVVDVPRVLGGLAAVSDALAAPLASAVALFPAMSETRPTWQDDDDWAWDDWEWDVEGGMTGLSNFDGRFGAEPWATPEALLEPMEVPGARTLALREETVLADEAIGVVVPLLGLLPGDVVEIELLDPTAFAVDTYLYLYDLDAGLLVADNDDAPGTDRSFIVFEVVEGVRYAVVATSYSGSDTGELLLSVAVRSRSDESAADAEEPEAPVGAETPVEPDTSLGDERGSEERRFPTFAEVVALFDTVTEFLDALAERSGVAMGWTEVSDGVVRSTLRIPLR
jgi:hypothetical protein